MYYFSLKPRKLTNQVGNRVIKLFAFFLLSALLSGCASGTKFSELSVDDTQAQPEKSQIVLYRTAFLGAAVQPTIYVDGKTTGNCTPEGVFVVDVSPGEHDVLVETEVKREIKVQVSEDERVYIRCSITFGLLTGRPKLELIDTKTGESEIKDLSFTGRY